MTQTLISPDNTWALWTVIGLGVAISIYLEQTYKWAAKVSGAIIALVIAMLLANFNVIPTDAPVYDTVWGFVVPLSLPLLLLKTDLRKIWKESGKMLFIFLVGSVGTVIGAVVGFALLSQFIPELKGIAGMMTGSYIGGSVNFAALKDQFSVSSEMVSAAVVADNLNMALYFFVLLAIPSIGFFRKHFKHPLVDEVEQQENANAEVGKTTAAAYWGKKEISLKDIAYCGAIAFSIVTIAKWIADVLASVVPTGNAGLDLANALLGSQYLWITTLSVICATCAPKFFGNIRGAQEIGTYLIYFFLFVIGVPASIPFILQNSPLLLVFTMIMVFCNMGIMFLVGKFTKIDMETIIIASNANIGGPTTAAGMAIAKGWNDLVGPSLLVGTFGYVIGTYLGLLVGSML